MGENVIRWINSDVVNMLYVDCYWSWSLKLVSQILCHWCACHIFSCRELFSPSQKYQLLVYHADAIFHDKEYRNAACKYNMALQQKKVLSKTSKVRPSTGGTASSLQSQVWKAPNSVNYNISGCSNRHPCHSLKIMHIWLSCSTDYM